MSKKTGLLRHWDIAFLIVIAASLILDIFLENEMFEVLPFLLTSIGFIISTMQFLKFRNDERIAHVSYRAGFASFMFTLILVFVFSVLFRYEGFKINMLDLFRILGTSMYLLYFSIFTFLKRKM